MERITYRTKSDSISENNIKMLNNLHYSTIAFSYDYKLLDSSFFKSLEQYLTKYLYNIFNKLIFIIVLDLQKNCVDSP